MCDDVAGVAVSLVYEKVKRCFVRVSRFKR